jgi:hypothetical protein
MTHARPAAFTLLETLLTLALLLVVVTLCGGFAFEARRVRHAVLEEVDTIAASRLFMERITSDLRCAAADPAVTFEGNEQGLRFATAALPPPGVWSTSQSLGDPPPAPVQDLRVVEYRLLYDESSGEPLAFALARRVVPAAVNPDDGGESPFADAQSDRLCFLMCRYWDGSQWLPQWRDVHPPRAVEISLGRQPLPPQTLPTDYPHETYRRVVALGTFAAPVAADTDAAADDAAAPAPPPTPQEATP